MQPRKSLPEALPQPWPRATPRKTPPGRRGYLSRPPDPLGLKSQVRGQGRRTPQAVVVGGVRAGRRRRPMDARAADSLAGRQAGPAGGVDGAPAASLSPLRPRGLRTRSAWLAAKSADCRFSFFPFCFTAAARTAGDFRRDFPASRDAAAVPPVRLRAAQRASQPASQPAGHTAMPRPSRPRPPPEKLLGPAPGCPRVSHLGNSEAAPNVTSMLKSQ